MVLS
ncbi:da35c6f0-c864-466f-a076-a4b42004bec8 [Thermothielavioides terrestris]|jgi:hypothetical protein